MLSFIFFSSPHRLNLLNFLCIIKVPSYVALFSPFHRQFVVDFYFYLLFCIVTITSLFISFPIFFINLLDLWYVCHEFDTNCEKCLESKSTSNIQQCSYCSGGDHHGCIPSSEFMQSSRDYCERGLGTWLSDSRRNSSCPKIGLFF